jgi:hypothetical protein
MKYEILSVFQNAEKRWKGTVFGFFGSGIWIWIGTIMISGQVIGFGCRCAQTLCLFEIQAEIQRAILHFTALHSK